VFDLVDFRVTKLNLRTWNLPDGTIRFPIIYLRVYTHFIYLLALVFQITTTPPNFFLMKHMLRGLKGPEHQPAFSLCLLHSIRMAG
jgi:hypothetical protein